MSKGTWTPEKNAADIWRILKETAASQKETEAELKQLAASNAASQKRIDAELEKLIAENAKVAAKWEAEVAERKKSSAELDAKIDRLVATQDRVSKELGGIGQNIGGLAEDFFYYNAPEALKKEGFRIDSYDRNVFYNDRVKSREYDIIGVNGNYVVVIEVKAQLKKKHVREFIGLLPYFVKDFPEHKGKKIYGGMAGMSVGEKRGEEEIIKKALGEKGLFMLTQTDSDAVAVHKLGKGIANLRNFSH